MTSAYAYDHPMEQPLIDVGSTIRRLAEERGMELQTLAFALGVSPQTVSRWVNSRVAIPDGKLLRIAAILQVPPEELGIDPSLLQQPAPPWFTQFAEQLLQRIDDLEREIRDIRRLSH